MIVVATAITWIFASKSTTISTNQIYIYIACLAVGVLQFLYNFAKYILNKTKKSLEINKNGLAYNSFFAVLIIVLTLALNILFGMKLDNILEYSASFILPMCLSLILLINPLIKKILSKLSKFYIS